jgi:hypothetical protein
MKKFAAFFTFVMVLSWFVSACAPAAANTSRAVAPALPPSTVSKSVGQDQQGFGGAPSDSLNAPSAPAAPPAPGAETSGAVVSGAVPADAKRIVIKNATLSIVVKDPGASMDRIGKLADQMGGFIVSSNIYKTTTSNGVEIPQAQISIRVPANQLTVALDKIKSEVTDPTTDIITENVTGSDVTKEYTDLQSRLTNLQNAADQLKTIMAQAQKTEDVMSVYNQLMQVNEQIEVLKGQIKYYDEASNMSEIAVTLQSEAAIAPLTVGGWKPEGVARDAVQALINSLQFLANATIWIVILVLPILILLALAIYILFIIIRAIFKGLNKSKKPKTPPAE